MFYAVVCMLGATVRVFLVAPELGPGHKLGRTLARRFQGILST
jgi:hypothetical protein